MNYLKTSDITTTNGMSLKGGSLEHIQIAYKDCLSAIVQNIVSGATYLPNKAYVLTGCIKSGVDISNGYIFFNEEIYFVPAATIIPINVIVGNILTTYSTGLTKDPVDFSDGVPRNIHEIRRVNWSDGFSGSGNFDYSDVIDLRYRPQGGIGQSVLWKVPSGNIADYFAAGIGFHPYTLGWSLDSTFEGRVPVGYKVGDADFGTEGQSGGAKSHILTEPELPIITPTIKNPATTKGVKITGTSTPAALDNSPTELDVSNLSTIELNSIGGGLAHNNLQPYKTTLILVRIF